MPAYVLIVVTSIGVIVLLAVVILLLMRKKVSVSIAAFSWERTITLEKKMWVKETSNKKFPAESRNRKKKQENYRKSTIVERGQYVYRPENPGPNEYVWESRPVTEWKWEARTIYEYEMPRWQKGRTLSESGRSREHVYWPEYVPAEDVRATKRSERYTVYFVAKGGKRYSIDLAQNVWAALDASARYQLKTTLSGKVTKWLPVQSEPVKIAQ